MSNIFIKRNKTKIIQKYNGNSKKNLIEKTIKLKFCFLISCIGCACRFLYGPETKDDNKAQIEKSLDGKNELKLEVIFYKKNGTFNANNLQSDNNVCMFTFLWIDFCFCFMHNSVGSDG